MVAACRASQDEIAFDVRPEICVENLVVKCVVIYRRESAMVERDDDAANEASDGERDLRLLARPLTDLYLLTQAEKIWALKILEDAINIIPVLPQTSSQDLNDFLAAINSLLEDVAAEIDETAIAEDDEAEDREPDEEQ